MMLHVMPSSASWTFALRVALVATSFVTTTVASAQSEQYRAPDGTRYRSMQDTGAVARTRLEYRRDPSVEKAIALGTAQAGVRQFREAIETFTQAIIRHPETAVLHRWRGHRYLTIRDFKRAAEDLDVAISLDSALYGAWYHRGIVHFANGRFADAAQAFARALPVAPDPGERAGSVDWLWMSLMRDGDLEEARALLERRPDVPDAGNAYSRRLRLYRGEIGPDEVIGPADTTDVQRSTLLFGVGHWYLVRGDTAAARAWFRRAVDAGGWPGFGFIIAEAELAGRTRFGDQATHGVAVSACLAAIPPERLVRDTVSANVAWPRDVPDTGAVNAWRQQVVFLLTDAATLIRARLRHTDGTLPRGDPLLAWSLHPDRVRLTTHRSGRIRARPLGRETAGPPVTAGRLLATAIDSALRSGTAAFIWPDGLVTDSLDVDVSIHAVGDEAITSGSLTKHMHIPLYSLAVAPERAVEVAPGSRSPRYPPRARSDGAEATVHGRFLVDSTGRVVPGSFQEIWNSALSRPTGRLAVYYREFVDAIEDALPHMRFVPASIGGCPVAQLVQQPFVFALRR